MQIKDSFVKKIQTTFFFFLFGLFLLFTFPFWLFYGLAILIESVRCQTWNWPEHKWHSFFAWYPVRLQTGELIWLEVVERKDFFDSFGIAYRKKGS